MREVSRADDRDALELGPSSDAFGGHILARGAGIMRMDVEVCYESHGRDYNIIPEEEK